MKFLQLFDAIDKQKEEHEETLIFGLKGIKKQQFSNLKRHLYKQIVTSLRLIHINKDTSIEVREHIDFAKILYGKGLFHQSLKILLRAKRIAEKNDLALLILEIIEFQKLIEARHITRTGAEKNVELINEAEKKFTNVISEVRLSNLKILIHGWYIRNGHIRSEKDLQTVQKFFEDNLPLYIIDDLSFQEKVFLYQSFVWYYYIILDFTQCFEYSVKWVNLFKENPHFQKWDIDLMMRGYFYILTTAYYNRDKASFAHYLNEFEKFRKAKYATFNENSRIFSFIYVHNGRLTSYALSGEFEEGLKAIPKTIRRIKRYENRMDPHRIIVFYFKIAWICLAAGKAEKSIPYLNKLFQIEIGMLRIDLQIYSQLLFLMAHYDLENFDLMKYLIKRVEGSFKKIKSSSNLQVESIKFFKKIESKGKSDHKALFQEFSKVLFELQKDPYEKRAFLYLDIYSWVRSKVTRQSISDVVRGID
ncbi:MAG: hypothetical protein V3V00_15160 [Saprospiraceae bacterium]